MAEQPLRARPVQLLTLALYRSGRQAEALRVVDHYRSELAEAGLEPPVDITDLEQRVQVDDPELRRRPVASTAVRGYELAEQIGKRGSSAVFRGFQPALGREVAVKQVRAELADRPEFIRRFEAEARTVAALEHPFIVPLYDYWREPGSAYLVLRWLRGGTLEAALGGRPLSVEAVSDFVVQVGSALAAAHAAGVVHGDVRSANIFLDGAGNHYLGDFAIALDTAVPKHIGDDVRAFATVVHEALTGERPETFPSARRHRPDLPSAVDDVLATAAGDHAGDPYPSVGEFVDALLGALGGPPSPSRMVVDRVVNPYKGLAAFEEHEAADFHGRERLVDRLLAALDRPGVAGRLVAVVGPSGSGKSSLVRAGLLPRLRAGAIPGSERFFMTTMVPGTDPFRELERALARIATKPTAGLAATMAATAGGIATVVDAVVGDDTELLLVIDQFEELYTHVDSDTRRQHFLDRLHAALIAPDSHLRVVLTVRADFWDRPLNHHGLAQILQTAAVTVTPLGGHELEAAITRPARRMGVDPEPALVSAVVADVHDRPGTLPLLQYTLTELFEHRRGRHMELASYRALRGVAGSLARRAEELYGELSVDERVAARRTFSRLVTPGESGADARRRVVRSELGGSPEAGAVVERFGAARMLSFDRDAETREPTVEVAHEALITAWPRLRGWIEDDRDAIRALRRLTAAAAEWDRSGRSAADLYRGTRLDSVMAFADTHELTPAERDFLDASLAEADRFRRAQRRAVRRLRASVVVAAVVAVFAVAGGAIAFGQRNRADREASRADDQAELAVANAEEAEQTALEAVASAESLGRPDLGLLLAIAAFDREASPGSERALLNTLHAVSSRVSALALGQRQFQTCARDLGSGWFAAPGPAGLTLVGARSGTVVSTSLPTRCPSAVAPDRSRAAATQSDGSLAIWDVEADRLIARSDGANFVHAAFSPDGRTLLASTGRPDTGEVDGAVVLDADTGEVTGEIALPFPIDDLTWTRSGRVLLFGLPDPRTRQASVVVRTGPDGAEVTRIDGFVGGVRAGGLNADGTILWVGDRRYEVTFIDLATGAVLGSNRFRPDEIHIASAVDDTASTTAITVSSGTYLVDIATGRELAGPLRPADVPIALSVVDDDRIATVQSDGTVEILSWTGGGYEDQRVEFPQDSGFGGVQPDEQIGVIGFREDPSAFALLDPTTGEQRLIRFEDLGEADLGSGPSAPLGVMSLSGGRAAILRADLSGLVVDVRGSVVAHFDFAADRDLDFVSQSRTGDVIAFLVADASRGPGPLGAGALEFLVADMGPLELLPFSLELDDDSTRSWQPSVDGGLVTLAEGTLTRYDPAGDELEKVDVGDPGARIISIGRGLAVATGDGTVQLRDPDTLELLEMVAGPTGPTYAQYVDDRRILLSDSSGDAILYDLEAGTTIGKLLGEQSLNISGAPTVTADGKHAWLPVNAQFVKVPLDRSLWRDRACDLVSRELTDQEWSEFISDSEPRRDLCD